MLNRTEPFSLILVILFCLFGCSETNGPPEVEIPPEEFVQLYVDLLIAGETNTASRLDTTRGIKSSTIVDSIYAKHGVTEDQVLQTLEQYNSNPRRWKGFYDEVIKKLEEMQHKEQKKKVIE